MKYVKLMVIGLIVLMINGCAGCVLINQPIGEEPHKVKAEDWEGTWITPDGSLTIKVLDGENGILEIASIEDSSDTLKLKSYKVYLRDSGRWIFGSFKAKDNSEKDSYFWGRIKKEDRQIIFWIPDLEKFKNLVKEGKLPGKIKGDDVILGDLKPEHLEIITSGDSGLLFYWDEPIILMKLTK